jgi:predicted AAA+ superfamily ATPase
MLIKNRVYYIALNYLNAFKNFFLIHSASSLEKKLIQYIGASKKIPYYDNLLKKSIIIKSLLNFHFYQNKQ